MTSASPLLAPSPQSAGRPGIGREVGRELSRERYDRWRDFAKGHTGVPQNGWREARPCRGNAVVRAKRAAISQRHEWTRIAMPPDRSARRIAAAAARKSRDGSAASTGEHECRAESPGALPRRRRNYRADDISRDLELSRAASEERRGRLIDGDEPRARPAFPFGERTGSRPLGPVHDLETAGLESRGGDRPWSPL